MIISASYKTDIPAFYGRWFMNRLEAGYCKTVNPYNGEVQRLDLQGASVDGFVFWTRNIRPFLDNLDQIAKTGLPFVVQHTLTAYARSLEPSVIGHLAAIEAMRAVAERFGPKVLVWRYDPILFTSETPIDYHRRNFRRLAALLAGVTDEVVISFAQLYKKSRRNVEAASKIHGFSWEDPADDVKRALTVELADIAHSRAIQLSVCSQKAYLAPGVADARCVDIERLQQISGNSISAKRKGNRLECGCFESRDIGEYDTCPSGCVFCYANHSQQRAADNCRQHDENAEFLFQHTRAIERPLQLSPIRQKGTRVQLSLFPGGATSHKPDNTHAGAHEPGPAQPGNAADGTSRRG